MSDEEYADLINEKQELELRLRQLTSHVETIKLMLNRIAEIDQEIGM